MNNNFKINKQKPRLAAHSPYQRPVSGSVVGQNMYNPFQSNSTMGNAIRFPSNILSPQEKEKIGFTMPQYNPYATPGHNSNSLMRSDISSYGYPYFQNVSDNAPFYSELQSYTPLAMQEYSSFSEMDNAYQCQFEDVPSKKENYCQDFQSNNQFKPSTSTSQHKPTQCTSLAKKSGHQVRFDLSANDKIKDTNKKSGTDSLKTPKRWEDDSRPLRALTGSIDKIIKWEKMREASPILFEVVATLVTVRPGGSHCEKMLILREEATPALQCLFYTIDRPLPPLEKGQLIRCVGEMIAKNKLKTYSVRAATASEKSGLQRLSFASQRAVTALELATPEP